MEIIKKIPVNWSTLVDDIDNPNFIYFGKIQNIYDYRLKRYKVYTNKYYQYGTNIGYFPIQESKYTYVVKMKFKF